MVKLKLDKLFADRTASFSAANQLLVGDNDLVADFVDTDSSHYLILDSPIMVKEILPR